LEIKLTRMRLRFPGLLPALFLTAAVTGCGGPAEKRPPFPLKLSGTYDVGRTAYALDTGDLNGDSNTDLVVANYTLNAIRILTGDGKGSFVQRPELGLTGHHDNIRVSDVSGDGVPDLVVRSDDAKLESETVWHSLLLGDGRGGFSPTFPRMDWKKGESLFEAKGRGFRAVDLDSDGRQEQIRESRSPWVLLNPFSKNGAVEIYRSDGQGSWKKTGTYPTGEWPKGIAAGDLNLDGRLDIVTANYASNSLSFLEGVGEGRFAKRPDLATGDRPTDVAITDLNGDRRPDVVVTFWGEGTVRVYLNQPQEPK
jgi:hypothetical protein